MSGLDTRIGKTVLLCFRYQYDGNGNRTAKTGEQRMPEGKSGRLDISYAYNVRGQLLEEKRNGEAFCYIYDASGNRIRKESPEGVTGYCYNEKNQLIREEGTDGRRDYLYNRQGSIIREEGPFGIRRFWYNSKNQQVRAEREDGQVQENRYDAEGLRREIKENERLFRFVYHRGELLYEGGDRGRISYQLGAGTEAFVRDGEICYYHQDEQLSTALITDRDGKVLNHYQYDAFGNELEKEEQIYNRIRYTGQQYDSVTEQYYLRARYYNPILGRFLQEDVYQGDGLNLYAYCNNNPVVYYDPSGYSQSNGAQNQYAAQQTNGTGQGEGQSVGASSEFGKETGNKDTVPSDTYVFGNATKPGNARPGRDFGVENGNDVVSAQSPPLPKGKSVCANPYDTNLTGTIYKVPAGTELPDGLGIVYDGKDKVPGGHAEGHSTIYPTRDMTVDEFNELYQSMPWEKDGKKKE